MRFLSSLSVVALTLMMGCASPPVDGSDEESTTIPDGKADGARPSGGTPRQRFDRLVTLLRGGANSLDMPEIARDYELPFEDAVTVEVTTVPAPDGIAPIYTPAMQALIQQYTGDDQGTIATLAESGVRFAIQNFGARDYFLKTLIDRRVRAQVTELVGDADEVFRFGVYDNGSELVGDEYVALYFRDLDKAIVFTMTYSEEY